MIIQQKFEDLKEEITELLKSDDLTPKAILFKFISPEELLLKGFLFKCIYEMNDENSPFTIEDMKEFKETFKCNTIIREKTSGVTHKELMDNLSVISVMRYLEFELYNFLKGQKAVLNNSDFKMIWKIDYLNSEGGIDDFNLPF